MYEHDRDFYDRPRRPGIFPYVAVALISAIIGGLLVAFLLPVRYQQPGAKNPYNINVPDVPPQVTAEGKSPVVEIAEKVGPAVVSVESRWKVAGGFDFFGFHSQDVAQGVGSGVIFDERGYIVTNYHVISSEKTGQLADEIAISLADGRQVPVKLVGYDAQTDLAVLKTNEKNLPIAKFGSSKRLKVGELAVAIGSPSGLEFARSVTVGVISGLNRTLELDERTFSLIQTDAAINPGNSGGALVNSRGEVVGINSVKLSAPGIEGMGFAIPIDDALPIIEDIINYGHVKRPWIGIKGWALNAIDAKANNVPQGVVIEEVVNGGPADKAGIRPGDILTKVNGKQITEFNVLTDVVQKQKIGSKITIEVYSTKDKSTRKVTVVLGEMPAEF
ncbi:HtrA2 peptidase [Thermincola ferriacetica]|uniref:HtrA2 peptidase n=3 Tax=Thermincola TaxID=278993 RepID=D5X962_THEPJ|nr:trypsin-like peptidase domain-containing protein [Thermincola ferriacetica]ADG81062.1 HtrA2 peptidase [Thermincola potens JR]KNZ68907.1 HtrA2 peptidase [Thermincola ferriacetica]